MEKNAILDAISRLNGDKVKAAALLGIGKTTLYRKLKEYGIGEAMIAMYMAQGREGAMAAGMPRP